MNLLSNIIINSYSIVLLIIILYQSYMNSEDRSLQYKLYMVMAQASFVMLIVDILGRFDGKPDSIYPILNHAGNFLLFMLGPVLPSLWLLYVNYEIFNDAKRTKRLLFPLLALNAVNILLLVFSQFNGWYYYIDSDNIYHRGPLFMLSASITIILILITYYSIAVNRKRINKRHYFSLVFFAVPPSICIILQIIFYGLSLIFSGVVITMLIIFLNIQSRSMYTDYLTGINNRKKLETYLKQKISACAESRTFSAIMTDMNSFKSINDTLGHNIGDHALETSALLLKSCIGPEDFIARFGGDEFFIILNISNKDELEAIVCKIKDNFQRYNESNFQPYKLSISMGYAVYDCNSHMKADEFQKYVDGLMYEDKRLYKQSINQ